MMSWGWWWEGVGEFVEWGRVCVGGGLSICAEDCSVSLKILDESVENCKDFHIGVQWVGRV